MRPGRRASGIADDVNLSGPAWTKSPRCGHSRVSRVCKSYARFAILVGIAAAVVLWVDRYSSMSAGWAVAAAAAFVNPFNCLTQQKDQHVCKRFTSSVCVRACACVCART